jgi:hypothetical protein
VVQASKQASRTGGALYLLLWTGACAAFYLLLWTGACAAFYLLLWTGACATFYLLLWTGACATVEGRSIYSFGLVLVLR